MSSNEGGPTSSDDNNQLPPPEPGLPPVNEPSEQGLPLPNLSPNIPPTPVETPTNRPIDLTDDDPRIDVVREYAETLEPNTTPAANTEYVDRAILRATENDVTNQKLPWKFRRFFRIHRNK